MRYGSEIPLNTWHWSALILRLRKSRTVIEMSCPISIRPSSLLQAAQRRWLEVRDSRDLDCVTDLLRQALAGGPPGALDPNEASEAWTRLMLLLMQDGSPERQAEAEALMAARGYRFRLVTACLTRDVGSRCHVAAGVSAPPPCVSAEPSYVHTAQHVLPPLVLGALRRAFSKGSAFWHAHRYDDPATGYGRAVCQQLGLVVNVCRDAPTLP
jgi:hypothetical protein